MPVYNIPEPTKEEKLKAAKIEVMDRANSGLDGYKKAAKILYDSFWFNGEFTPEELLAEFGTEAVALFVRHGAVQQHIKGLDPDYELLSIPKRYFVVTKPEDITENPDKIRLIPQPDGSVVVMPPDPEDGE